MSVPDISVTPISREQRNAIFAAVAIFGIAFYNLTIVVTSLRSVSPQGSIEVAALVGLMVVSVVSGLQSFRGRLERGVWILIIAIMVVAAIRAIVRQDIGLPFGIQTAVLSSAIGSITLPINKADRSTLFGYIAGSLIVVFDTYAGDLYQRLPSPASMISAATALAGFIFVLYIILLITQSRSIGLAIKIANTVSLISLIVTITLGAMVISIIRNTLTADPTGLLQSAPLGLFGLIETLRRGTIVLGAVLTVVGSTLGIIIARSLAGPLNLLTETSSQLAQGNLTARVHMDREDEFGQVATAFNSMAAELNTMVDQLETRVAERTSDLKRRSIQIQTAAEIGSAAAKLRNLDQLLSQATQLISERFGFYHTGIFLLDERQEFAVLRAANSTGGQRMLARGHRLKVGQVGIVGYATGNGAPRIALDVGTDAVFFDNPDLPDTRSEMALPLIAGGEVLGALDVQSLDGNAFSQEDVSTLQVLADQVAIAIENARLFEQNQSALESIRRAYGDLSQSAWKKLQKAGSSLGYVSLAQGNIVPVEKDNPLHTSGEAAPIEQARVTPDGMTLLAPVKVRGLNIGTIRLKKPENSTPWSAEEIAVANTLTEQLSGTLESARLYSESLQRAEFERTVAEVKTSIGESVEIEDILRTTVEQIGRVFEDSNVSIRINPTTS